MSKTRIDWADYSINPVKGLCPMDCKDTQGKSYCYARRMYSNPYYKALYNYREIEFNPAVFNDLPKMKPGSRVFWGSTMELFGLWVKDEWRELIFEAVKRHPELTHIFLTKLPQNLPREWPENCWVGVSATDFQMYGEGLHYLSYVDAPVKFISFEPLLEQIQPKPWGPYTPEMMAVDFKNNLQWIIIGQATPARPSTTPRIEWITEIEDACKKAGVPYFEKDNLQTLLKRKLVQDFPKGVALGH